MMGQGVQIARSEIVMEARKFNPDELIFLDRDLDVNVNMMARMLSHEHEDIVCSMYCKKTIDTHWHVQGWSEEEEPDKNGLLRVKQAAIGFSKIKMSVFDRIQEKNPDRRGWLREVGTANWELWDFFPMELLGPGTPLERMRAVKDILDNPSLDTQEKINQIDMAVYKQHTEPNLHMGEDYWFCRLAREAGIKIKLDTELIIPHEGNIKFPVMTKDAVRILKEEWRQDDIKKEAIG